jgi:hypothetical protein
MVGEDDLNWFAQHAVAELLDRQFGRDDRALAGDVGGDAGHVGQHADLDDIVADLRVQGRGGEREQRAAEG